METKQYVHVEITKGEHTFTFAMPMGCTWGQAIDASFEILTHVTKLSQDVVERAKPAISDASDTTLTKGE